MPVVFLGVHSSATVLILEGGLQFVVGVNAWT